MKKNILILSTSPRKNGNSEMLARRHRPKNEGRRGNRIRHPHLFL